LCVFVKADDGEMCSPHRASDCADVSESMPARSTTHARAIVLRLAAVCLAGAVWACHDAVGPQREATPTTTQPPSPPAPRVVDLRFKGVGVLTSASGGLHTDILASSSGAALWQQFDSAAGSPLALGSGICSVTDCAWFLYVFALPKDVARLATVYRASFIADLPRFTNPAVPDTVITSLDFQPAVGLFALSEFATSRSGGYHLTQRRVPLSGIQAAAAAEAAAKRVITAVAFDSGQVRLLSYAWDHDTTQGYDANVVQATIMTAGAAAEALAADGYVVTAIGGNPTDGFLLVGTRLHGQTDPRSLLINPSFATSLSGYAVVGYLYDALAGGVATLILER
jgi:hypothetical protein